jgi:thiaminase
MQKELLLLLGIDNSAATAASATLNYASFLKKASSANSLEAMVSSMAPCPWSSFEIAQK